MQVFRERNQKYIIIVLKFIRAEFIPCKYYFFFSRNLFPVALFGIIFDELYFLFDIISMKSYSLNL